MEKKYRYISLNNITIHSEHINIKPFTKTAIFKNIEITDANNQIHIQIPKIGLHHIRIYSLITNKNITINNVVINSADVQIHSSFTSSIDTSTKNSSSTHNIYTFLNKVYIPKFSLILYQDCTNDTIFYGQGNIDIEDLKIQLNKDSIPSNIIKWTAFKCNIPTIAYTSANKQYNLSAKNLQYDSYKKKLNCDSIDLIPYKTYTTGDTQKAHYEWYQMYLKNIKLKNFDLLECITQSSFIFTTGIIEDIQLKSYKDKRVSTPKKKDSQLPMQAIKQLPFRFHSDSILINNGTITYSEREKNSFSPGTITFSHVQTKLVNLSTIPELIKGPTKIYSKTKVMNHGELEASFVFPNEKFQNKYQVNGHMNALSMKTFNSFLEQNTGLSITSGKIKKVDFNFSFDQNKSTGNLNLDYENLEIVTLQHDKVNRQVLKSLLLNKLLIHKDNLSDSETYKKGTIYYVRDKNKSVFNYWWHSVLSGITNIVVR